MSHNRDPSNMQVLMKNTTCTLITKIGLRERVKREYSKI
jgi:hypothetical protein